MKSQFQIAGWILMSVAHLLPAGQITPARLALIVIEGDGAINNVKQRTTRETIVRVEDENHKPVVGAAVMFLLPSDGPGGVFTNGASSSTVLTDTQGQARLPRMQANQWAGSFRIRVSASYRGSQSSIEIGQTNAPASVAPVVHAGLSAKVIGAIAAGAIAAGAGAARGLRSGSKPSSSTPAAAPGVGISLGSGGPVLAPPH